MTSRIKLGIGGLVVAAAGIVGLASSQVSSDEVPSGKVERIPVEVESPQKNDEGVRLEDLMDSKLLYSEKILAGLVTHDFELIAKSAESIKLIGLRHARNQKTAEDGEVYEHFRTEFARQASRLEEEAKKENLAGAAYFAQNLTATCIACHDYIRDDLK
jgi:hypothetical protein